MNLKLEPENGKKIAKLGEMIKVRLLRLALHNMLKKLQQKGIVKVSCQEQHPVEHPTMSYPGPDILVFTGPPRPGSGASATNTVVMSNGQLDWNRPDTFTAMLDRQDGMSHIPRHKKYQVAMWVRHCSCYGSPRGKRNPETGRGVSA